VRLVICGAGDDAQPLSRMAHTLGWRVCVLDHRAGFATRERFPEAERVEVVVAGTLPSDFTLDPRTVAVIMNHHYPSDGAWLSTLAPLPITYLGLLGARHRTARLLRDAELPPPGLGGLPHLFAPAGLDIGAEGPEGIALAMLAEMQSVIAGRRGGRLRESASPIQQTPLEAVASPAQP
jgi:xanthine dehydrogenase accessory factor